MFQQDEAAVDGFEYLTNLLIRYSLVEEDVSTSLLKPPQYVVVDFLLWTFCSDSSSSQSINRVKAVSSVRTKIINLYSQAFLCYIRLVRHYSRGTLFRSVRDLAVADDWKSLLEGLKKTESQIDKDIQSLTGHIIGPMDSRVREIVEKVEDPSLLQKQTFSEVEVCLLLILDFTHAADVNAH